jgi:intermembrane space import and assembly protein 40
MSEKNLVGEEGVVIKLDTEISTDKDAVYISEYQETNSEPEAPQSAIGEDGTINWDCPCLGGMAKGPCGEEFKAAFSCFIRSEPSEENGFQKGFECVSNFQKMQDCFKQFPEYYADQLSQDEDETKNKEGAENGDGDIYNNSNNNNEAESVELNIKEEVTSVLSE